MGQNELQIIHVDLGGDEREIELREGSTLLSMFEESNAEHPNGCRVGVCGACITRIEEVSEGGGDVTIRGLLRACISELQPDLQGTVRCVALSRIDILDALLEEE